MKTQARPTGCAVGTRRRQRGLSLVEMMVGIAIGLFIVAGATLMAVTQLTENRKLQLEIQVQQDLRAASDHVSRELRRAGGDEPHVGSFFWTPAYPTLKRMNFFGMLNLSNPTELVSYSYTRNGINTSPDYYGYRLLNGVIQHRAGPSAFQDLTDRSTVEITAFSVTATSTPERQLPCPRLCPDGTQDCWPTLSVRDYTVSISGRSVADPNLVRTATSHLHLRNDRIEMNVPGVEVCP